MQRADKCNTGEEGGVDTGAISSTSQASYKKYWRDDNHDEVGEPTRGEEEACLEDLAGKRVTQCECMTRLVCEEL
jgi:hypothetical protein